MGRRLAAAVHVQHPKTNEWLILEPGEEPDEVLAEVITNPSAWEPDEDEEGADIGDSSRESTALREAEQTPAPEPAPAPEVKAEPTPAPAATPEPEAKPARTRTRKQADA
ncbi:hypothetical protein [Streptomyces sp. NPDC056817]|uniref:hypothetical protein n=1 Tax=Streptomyces sp. NPDC056817 TaxID=3345950 RepID=UPI0036AC3BA0